MSFPKKEAALAFPERSTIYETDRPCGRKSAVRLIWDQHDRREDLLRLNALHNPDRGVLVVHAPPRSSGWLAFSILEALGKERVGPATTRNPGPDMALTWLRGERIQELLIYGAHRIQEDLWKYIEFGPRLWLISGSVTACDRLASQYQTRAPQGLRSALNLIEKTYGPPQEPGPSDEDEGRGEKAFPLVPTNDFTTFLSACRDTLNDPAKLTAVQKAFINGRDTAWDALKESDDDLNSRTLIAALEDHLVNTLDQREAICVLRGMQTGFFWSGLHLDIDIRDVLAAISIDRRFSNDKAMRAGIRRRTEFLGSSAAVLAHTTSLTDAEIANLTRDSIPKSCNQVELNGKTWEIPDELRSPLRILTNAWSRPVSNRTKRESLLYGHYPQLTESVGIKRGIWHFQQDTGIKIRASKTEHTNNKSGKSLLARNLQIKRIRPYQ